MDQDEEEHRPGETSWESAFVFRELTLNRHSRFSIFAFFFRPKWRVPNVPNQCPKWSKSSIKTCLRVLQVSLTSTDAELGTKLPSWGPSKGSRCWLRRWRGYWSCRRGRDWRSARLRHRRDSQCGEDACRQRPKEEMSNRHRNSAQQIPCHRHSPKLRCMRQRDPRMRYEYSTASRLCGVHCDSRLASLRAGGPRAIQKQCPPSARSGACERAP